MMREGQAFTAATLDAACAALSDELIELRRALHQIPEIGDALPLTKRLVCEYLAGLGLAVRGIEGADGVIAEIGGGAPGPTLALRADMDGLHIDESADIPYRSTIAGQMHGCGHDAHTAILLLTAKLLSSHKESLHGCVRLIFQTGEETGSGAKRMIASGALDGVSAMVALHVGNLAGDALAAGDFAILPGFVSAGKIKFTVTVKGRGTHSAFPEKGIDPIGVAAKIVLGLKRLMSEEVAEGTAAVLSVGSLQAGEDHNTIPEIATIRGSIRAQDPAVREFLAGRLQEIADEMAAEVGAVSLVDIKRGSSSVKNDAPLAALAARAVGEALPASRVYTSLPRPLMASDDFANYAERIPAVYFMLHTNNPEKGITEANHSPRFSLDEAVLYRGVAAYAAIALAYLK